MDPAGASRLGSAALALVRDPDLVQDPGLVLGPAHDRSAAREWRLVAVVEDPAAVDYRPEEAVAWVEDAPEEAGRLEDLPVAVAVALVEDAPEEADRLEDLLVAVVAPAVVAVVEAPAAAVVPEVDRVVVAAAAVARDVRTAPWSYDRSMVRTILNF